MISHLWSLKVLEREENGPRASRGGMGQTREPQLVLAEGFTLGQALWSCPTAPHGGDQSQHRAAEEHPQGVWSRSGGGKGTSSATKGARDKQISHAMPNITVSTHPTGSGAWTVQLKAIIPSLKVLLPPPINASRTQEILNCLLRVWFPEQLLVLFQVLLSPQGGCWPSWELSWPSPTVVAILRSRGW